MPSQKNKQEVLDIKKSLEEFPVIGILNMRELPSFQLQKLRLKLKETFLIKGVKRRLLKLAIEQVKDKENIKELEKFLDSCIPALLLSKEDPFKIAKLATKNKSNAPARAGQKAPFDLNVQAGPTPFAPGPIIGELSQLGIKTKVENGKLTIIQPVTLVKKDEIISFKAADLLAKLGFEPMEIGLNIVALYEKGQIYSGDTLVINEKEYIEKIKLASSYAFNLAFNTEYPTKETIQFLIQKASLEANALESSLSLPKTENSNNEEKQEKEVIEMNNSEEIKEEKQDDNISETQNIEDLKEEQTKQSNIAEEDLKQIVKEQTNEIKEKESFVEIKKEVKEEEIKDASQILLDLTDKKIKENEENKIKKSKVKTPTARELAGWDKNNQKQHGGK